MSDLKYKTIPELMKAKQGHLQYLTEMEQKLFNAKQTVSDLVNQCFAISERLKAVNAQIDIKLANGEAYR